LAVVVMVVVVVAVGMGMFGCAHQRNAVRVRTYPAPTAAELIARLGARQADLASLNARVRATSWLGGDRVRATVLMLVERSGKLRFEAQVSLQGTVAVLATDTERFSLLDVAHNELRSGPACPRNVAALIRIPLAPAEVAALLLGDVRLPDPPASRDPARQARVEWDAELGGDVLVVPRLDGWLRVVFAAPTGPSVGGTPVPAPVPAPVADPVPIWAVIATGPDGSPRWRARFEDFVAPSFPPGSPPTGRRAPPVPRLIRYAEGSASFEDGVEIKFKERVYDEPAPADAFAIAPTPGVKIVEVGCR
jgi:hypothetical protein